MSVKVHDLSPMTELDIHTAFSSAIAGELRPPPLMRVIYRVGTHWRLPRRVLRCSGIVLEPERKPDEKPSRTVKVPPPVRISPCGHDCHYRAAWSCAPTTRFLAQLFGKRGQSTTLFTVGHDPRLIDLSWKDDRTLLIRYPSDSAILPNFAVNRNGKAFKLSASDMPRITTSPWAKCHPSRDGCGEGPKVVGVTSRLHSLTGGRGEAPLPPSA